MRRGRALRRRYGHVSRLPPLTGEQLSALHRFAAKHGRYWKGRVRDMWMQGGAHVSTDDESIVYALRNTHGPSWLIRFRGER